jgi:hypothetical protein
LGSRAASLPTHSRTTSTYTLRAVESKDHAHPQLQAQINEYKRGGDGLRGNQPYTGPNVPLGRWKESPYNPANIKPDTAVYYVNVSPGSVLYGLDVDRNKIKTRERGYKIQAAKQVKRWGRWNIVTAQSTYYDLNFLSAAEPACNCSGACSVGKSASGTNTASALTGTAGAFSEIQPSACLPGLVSYARTKWNESGKVLHTC